MNKGIQKLCKDKKLRKFIIISIVMFATITALSFIFFTSCTDDVCNTDYINIINVVIISFGILGLVYCFFILKDFNKKVDDEIIPEYKEMLKDLDKEKNDKDKKLLSF